MNTAFLSKTPWLSLFLLWLTYALLGWYLSAHHIVWLVGVFVAAVALAVVWKSSPWLEHLIKIASQGLFAILIISLIFSVSVSLALTRSLLLALIVVPIVITFLAELEMRFAGLSKSNAFLFLIILAGLGLGLGEMVDIVFLPSMRY